VVNQPSQCVVPQSSPHTIQSRLSNRFERTSGQRLTCMIEHKKKRKNEGRKEGDERRTQFDVTSDGHHNVCALDVAMNQVVLVKILYTFQYLLRCKCYLFFLCVYIYAQMCDIERGNQNTPC